MPNNMQTKMQCNQHSMRLHSVSGLYRGAAVLLALCGILLSAPRAAHSEETLTAPPAPVQRIILPAMRVGGIPQGQIMQITEHGSEMIAVPKVTPTMIAANTRASTVVVVAAETKPKLAPKLFCAGMM